MDQVFALISNLGFPIVVSVYLLVRIESRMEVLSRSITELAKVVAALKS